MKLLPKNNPLVFGYLFPIMLVCLGFANYCQAQNDIYLKPRSIDTVRRTHNRSSRSMFSTPTNNPYRIYLLNRYAYNNCIIVPDQSRSSNFENVGSLATTLGTYVETFFLVGLQVEIGLMEKNAGIRGIVAADDSNNIYHGVFHYSQKFIHLPVMLRINPLGSSDDAAGLYILAGADFNFLLFAQNVRSYDLKSKPVGNYLYDITDKMKQTEISLVGGVGGNLKLTNSLGLFAETRAGSGLTQFVPAGFANTFSAHLTYWQVSGGLRWKVY